MPEDVETDQHELIPFGVVLSSCGAKPCRSLARRDNKATHRCSFFAEVYNMVDDVSDISWIQFQLLQQL